MPELRQCFALIFLTRSQPFLCTRVAGHGDDLLEDGWGFTPKCQMDDAERFRGCLPLTALCSACGDVRITVSCHYCIIGISHYVALRSVSQEREVKSVQQLGDSVAAARACLSCDICGSQYFGRQ
jgi:hypothetical protein